MVNNVRTYNFLISGSVGLSQSTSLLGFSRPGWSRLGNDTLFNSDIISPGIYQRYITNTGKRSRLLNFYVPTNPRTEEQQNHRTKYGEAVEAWNNLTLGQKIPYNEKAKDKPYSGYNLFIKEYILSH